MTRKMGAQPALPNGIVRSHTLHPYSCHTLLRVCIVEPLYGSVTSGMTDGGCSCESAQ
jgi:hypothetical protein